MKSILFSIQVLGLLLFIPVFVLLEFNHNNKKQRVSKDSPTENTIKQEHTASQQLAEKDLLTTGFFLIYY